eukprot:753673-Hanusia_phi.AAC.3
MKKSQVADMLTMVIRRIRREVSIPSCGLCRSWSALLMGWTRTRRRSLRGQAMPTLCRRKVIMEGGGEEERRRGGDNDDGGEEEEEEEEKRMFLAFH